MVLETTFGPMQRMFKWFNPVPIGVGAIAQVYQAALIEDKEFEVYPEKETSSAIAEDDANLASQISTIVEPRDTRVAVKIIHPNAKELILQDLSIMRGFANIIETLIPSCHWLSLPDEVEMFGHMMEQQCDMIVEARNLDLFHQNFRNWKNVSFPRPFLYLSTPKILIESYCDGIPLTKILHFGPTKFDKKIATFGLTSFLKMLLLDNHVHADLHPGNILVNFEKNKSPLNQPQYLNNLSQDEFKDAINQLHDQGYEPCLNFIDAGLVSTLSSQLFINFTDLFQAITKFDGPKISELMITRSRTPDTVIDASSFTEKMTQFIIKVKEKTLKFQAFSVSDILSFVFDQVRTHHIKIEGDFVNIGVGLLLIEGIGRRLEPDLDLLHASIPFLKQAIGNRSNMGEMLFIDLLRMKFNKWIGKSE